MNTKKQKVLLLAKSYGIAFAACLLLTGINAVLDFNNPYEQNSTAYILAFHLLSALVYGIPVSFLVYYVIRNQDRSVRAKKFVHLVVYISSIVVGGFLGSLVAHMFFIPEYEDGSLDSILPYSISFIFGAVLLPLVIYLAVAYVRKREK